MPASCWTPSTTACTSGPRRIWRSTSSRRHSLEEAKALHGTSTAALSRPCGAASWTCELKMKEEAGMSPPAASPLQQEHLGDTCPICGQARQTHDLLGRGLLSLVQISKEREMEEAAAGESRGGFRFLGQWGTVPAPLERRGTVACPAGAPFLGKKWGKNPRGKRFFPLDSLLWWDGVGEAVLLS